MPNCYATLDELKSQLSLGSTTAAQNERLLSILEQVSRWLDAQLGRVFFTRIEARYFPARSMTECAVDDLLALTELKTDSVLDGTFATTWTTGDYALAPSNEYPKTKIVARTYGDYRFPYQFADGVKATGTWGYGDGERAAPWDTVTGLAITCGVGDISILAAGLKAGQTILVNGEQLFVKAVSDTEPVMITVQRGVNGTTAAAHTNKAVAIAAYPKPISMAAIYYGAEWYGEAGHEGIATERIGVDWNYTRKSADEEDRFFQRVAGAYRRIVF